jgi:hypothetical protein
MTLALPGRDLARWPAKAHRAEPGEESTNASYGDTLTASTRKETR